MNKSTNDVLDDIRTKKLDFRSLTPSEQLAIKENRSTPDLECLYNDVNSKKFNKKWYDEYPWLCGSKATNRLYCIACMIYGGEAWWANDGIDSLKKFPEKPNKHQISKSHIKNMESYVMAGKTPQLRENSIAAKPRENLLRKEILSKIIDSIMISQKFGQNIELFDEQTKNSIGDLIMKKYLCDNLIYKQIYAEEKEKLIKTMESQLLMDIKKEISKTPFCSILVDSLPTKANEYSVMVRYVFEGVVKVRFVGFHKIVQIFDLAQIFNNVTGDVRKAVCHSYDGYPAMKPLRDSMKTCMTKLLFLPNHLHRLSTIVLQNLENIAEIRQFIRNVTYVCNFLKAPKRSRHVKIFGLNFPAESETLWRFHSKTISSILANQHRILKIANNLTIDPYVIDLESNNSAYTVKRILTCPLFMMLCSFFSKIFQYIECLVNCIHKRLNNVTLCMQEVEQTSKKIANLNAAVFLKQCMDESKIRIKKNEMYQTKMVTFKACVSKVKCIIAAHILEVNNDIKNLKFIELFNENVFSSYWNKFPKAFFTESMSFYEDLFNTTRLENELILIYSDPMKKMNPYSLFCYLHDNHLAETYKETYRLLQLYLSYPLLAVGNVSSSWNKLKKFVNTKDNQEKSAMLFVESYPQGSSEYLSFKKNVIQTMS